MKTDTAARREQSTAALESKRQAEQSEATSIAFGFGMGLDADESSYRRLTTGAKLFTRDLTPLSHDRALEVSWWLFEQNPFAHRLITLMTDLIVGDGVTIEVEADDERIQTVVSQFFQRNQLGKRLREFYMANSLNGELIFPVGVNPFNGLPILGYLDSAQIKGVVPVADNILVLDELILKPTGGSLEERRLKIIRENPATGKLEGEVFFHRINSLPNSLRGRPDLMPLADWLDLYDQFMFSEVERLNLLSSFAWDYTIEGASSPEEIQKKIRALPKLKPGAVFGHNEKEKLEPRTPDLKAQDRSEVARMLRVHIAGSMGFPISYLGDTDSNRATIEGQNDIMLKTPAARQKEFAGLIDLMVRFAIEQATGKNPALFADAMPLYRISMPEIAAKDIARVGTVMASVVSSMDTALANKTVSKKTALRVVAAMITQLGIKADAHEIAAELDDEAADQTDTADLLQAALAQARNPPVPGSVVPGSTEDPTVDPTAAD
jgi:hypothetical protein